MNKDKEIKKLKQQIAQMHFVIDQVPNFLFWKDVNSVFMGCNKLFALSAGLQSSSEIEGKSDFDLPWGNVESNGYIEDDRAVMQATEPKLNIEEVQTVENRKVTLLTSKVPLMDGDEIKGIIGIYSDITELKEAQEELKKQKLVAEAANTVKSNFLATMSHELRTPLNGILGTLQVMKKHYVDDQTCDFIGDIKGAASSLLSLVDDVLDISCLEQGRLVIKHSVFALGDVTERAIADVIHLADEKGIALTLYSALGPEDQFFGDPVRIKQILVNLLNNAIKFTDLGTVSVYVDLEKIDDMLHLVCSVVDTGIGILPQKCDLIFERFVQVDSKYSRRYAGVGLGLAICSELVTAMGGEIGVESRVGKGSTFKFSVPIETREPRILTASTFSKAQLDRLKGAVLIVEDNPLNSRVLQLMLEDFEVDVQLAESGQSALEHLKSGNFNLIFLDISLPDMDGFLIASEIRRQKSKLELPIIAVTAHAFESDKVACLESGMNDVLVKPISMNQLTEKLIQWLPQA
ncbi:MAG: hypothetical protein COB66_04820 [Coxiella sp. (in: Bacteria)]|nr:MAG: hypothetical protein COB66_04820 [Coxiella sp. (in: g-proteobacteria)]